MLGAAQDAKVSIVAVNHRSDDPAKQLTSLISYN